MEQILIEPNKSNISDNTDMTGSLKEKGKYSLASAREKKLASVIAEMESFLVMRFKNIHRAIKERQ
jgi:hypothetical protein